MMKLRIEIDWSREKAGSDEEPVSAVPAEPRTKKPRQRRDYMRSYMAGYRDRKRDELRVYQRDYMRRRRQGGEHG